LRIQRDGILVIPESEARDLCLKWRPRFRTVNRTAMIAGALEGTLLVVFNYIAYSTPGVGFWVSITDDRRSWLVAFVFLYCIFAVYSFTLFYIIRSVALTLFLNDVVGHAQLQMLPFHPDKCGGLRPMGKFGLRNQYLLTILGLNIVFLVVVTVRYLKVPTSLAGLVAAAGGRLSRARADRLYGTSAVVPRGHDSHEGGLNERSGATSSHGVTTSAQRIAGWKTAA
jgi:hypothetical protein